jgi:hypothetical protein
MNSVPARPELLAFPSHRGSFPRANGNQISQTRQEHRNQRILPGEEG